MKRLLLTLLLLATAATPAHALTEWAVVAQYPHDPAAFTEGLLFSDGQLYESTGMVGQSDIRIVRLEDGKILHRTKIPAPYFGEGMVLWKGKAISLTWRHGKGFIWSLPGFRKTGEFAYKGEGWALTTDGKQIIMSDGTADLRFLDPDTLKETRRITATWQGQPIPMLNELEYVDGEILANIWMTSTIVRIDPTSGSIIDLIDMSELVRKAQTDGVAGADDVLNGIAWDAKGKRLFVTGKNWSQLYEIVLKK